MSELPNEPPATLTPHWTAFYEMVEELAKRLPKTPANDEHDEHKAPARRTRAQGADADEK